MFLDRVSGNLLLKLRLTNNQFMLKPFLVLITVLVAANVSQAQKGHAENDFFPMGYTLDTWTGEVTAFDNDRRTLTLTYRGDNKSSTFVATIPDAPYEWGHDARKFRVVDFPYDKKLDVQTFIYISKSGVYYAPPGTFSPGTPMQRRPNPPASNVINDFGQFMGHTITVYYTARERTLGNAKEKYNDVWRIRILPSNKP